MSGFQFTEDQARDFRKVASWWIRNSGETRSLAGSIRAMGYTWEDVKQEAALLICRYAAGRKERVTTLTVHAMRFSLGICLEKSLSSKRSPGETVLSLSNSEIDVEIEDHIYSKESDPATEAELRDLWDCAMSCLTGREASMLSRLMQGESCREIGAPEGISPQRVQQIAARAREKIRKHFLERSDSD